MTAYSLICTLRRASGARGDQRIPDGTYAFTDHIDG